MSGYVGTCGRGGFIGDGVRVTQLLRQIQIWLQVNEHRWSADIGLSGLAGPEHDEQPVGLGTHPAGMRAGGLSRRRECMVCLQTWLVRMTARWSSLTHATKNAETPARASVGLLKCPVS
jgi:hypothetical protein